MYDDYDHGKIIIKLFQTFPQKYYVTLTFPRFWQKSLFHEIRYPPCNPLKKQEALPWGVATRALRAMREFLL
jgi:hypothetical protein